MREIILAILLTGLLFSNQAVYAGSGLPIVVQPIINIDVSGIINAVISKADQLGNAVNAVGRGVGDALKAYLEGSIESFNSPVLLLMEYLISANPNPEPMKPWFDSVVIVISALYLLVFVCAGLMFLLSAISPEKRIEAKIWLRNTAFIIALVSFSYPIY